MSTDSVQGKIENLPKANDGYIDALRGKKKSLPKNPDYLIGYMRGREQKILEQMDWLRKRVSRVPQLLPVLERLKKEQNDASKRWVSAQKRDGKTIEKGRRPDRKAKNVPNGVDGQNVTNMDKKEGVRSTGRGTR